LVAVAGTSWQKGCLAETETRAGGTASRVDDLGPWIRKQILSAQPYDAWPDSTRRAAVAGVAVPPGDDPNPHLGGPIAEDFAYPGAAAILADQNVELISGDGHLLLVDCATPVDGDIGLLKVWTTDSTIGPDGLGRLCFRITAPARTETPARGRQAAERRPAWFCPRRVGPAGAGRRPGRTAPAPRRPWRRQPGRDR
jgi:hypothetical protein